MLGIRSTKKGFTFSVKAKPERIKASSEYQFLRSLSSPWFLWSNLPNDCIYLCTVSTKKQASSLINQGESL
jgi:hypothetical protein